MAATTRWVEYSTTSATSEHLGTTTSGVGTVGYVEAQSTVGDKFTIGATNNKLSINIDAVGAEEITLTSGVDLDPRFVARDITEKMHIQKPSADSWVHATCVWENNKIKIYSGNIGASSTATVASGTHTAYDTLGFTSNYPYTGQGHSWKGSNGYDGAITISGTWEGMFDEVYTVIINKEETIGTPQKTGSYTGTMSKGGQYNCSPGDTTYTITIDTTNGATVGGGTTHVPTYSWTSTPNSDPGGPIEILYADHWYKVGTRGLKVKWTDAVFGSGDLWTVACTKPTKADTGDNPSALPGTALYVYTSSRGDDSSGGTLTSDTGMTRVGKRGLYMQFGGGSTNLFAGDEFRVVCRAPQPSLYSISSLNYGNVTVTTESPVKCVMFEIMSGAVMMTAVKFGLQNHGSFSYHSPGDTYFRYGTIGGEKVSGGAPTEHKEWRTSVIYEDIDSDTPPAYLFATKANLSVVATADDSESLGNYQGGLVSDFVYLCIRLGADETGSNSSINYRLYFDYS